ncbi:MAPEG family protein [Rhodoferax sp. OV413]|uniref:MAPEG family protein n=1 Tax=Rhodoferax sp. OV413 TaxID=1855285 RepID=UPI0025FAF7C3|nr:MAPEG family protein [Rhodoferax sp. OV413]
MQNTTFTLAYWCVLVAALLPIVCAGVAKSGRFGVPRKDGGYDNVNPREWLARQTDWRARANAAQANSFEALPFFIGAVVIAHQLGAAGGWVDALAVLFVLLRVLYVVTYVSGKAAVRSVLWIAALAVNIGILLVGYH